MKLNKTKLTHTYFIEGSYLEITEFLDKERIEYESKGHTIDYDPYMCSLKVLENNTGLPKQEHIYHSKIVG